MYVVSIFVTNNKQKDQVIAVEPWVHIYRLFAGETLEIRSTYITSAVPLAASPFNLVAEERVITLFPMGSEVEILRGGVVFQPFDDGFPDDFKEFYK
jgi:hypothetical protein